MVKFLMNQGYPDLRYWDIPPEISDLACWPLWIQLLAKFGTEAASGLFLLQELVDYRLTKQSPVEGRRIKIKEVLGQIALACRPSISISRTETVNRIADWGQEEAVLARYKAEPAESLIEHGLATGIIEAEGQSLIFVHPLLATVLAAEAAATQEALPPQVFKDQELAAFVVPLLPEGRSEDLITILRSQDIFVLARTLRLAQKTERSNPIESDLIRFDQAYRQLAPMAGMKEARLCLQETTSLIHSDQWMALARRPGKAPEVMRGEGFARWAHPPNAGTHEYVLWDINPLKSLTPEFLAATEVLARFKRNFKELQPPGDPYVRAEDEELQDLLNNPAKLENLIVRFVSEMNEAKKELAEAAGLLTATGIRLGDGQPEITLRLSGEASRFTVKWGQPALRYSVLEEDPDFEGFSLRSVVADDVRPLAYEELKREVEQEVGSSIDSQAWQKPHLLAEWIW